MTDYCPVGFTQVRAAGSPTTACIKPCTVTTCPQGTIPDIERNSLGQFVQCLVPENNDAMRILFAVSVALNVVGVCMVILLLVPQRWRTAAKERFSIMIRTKTQSTVKEIMPSDEQDELPRPSSMVVNLEEQDLLPELPRFDTAQDGATAKGDTHGSVSHGEGKIIAHISNFNNITIGDKSYLP